MDATSFRLQSKHGLDDGWNERKDNPSLTAQSLFAEAHLRPDDVDLEATHHQSFLKQQPKALESERILKCTLLEARAQNALFNS